MKKLLVFDMDGTIADLYAVDDWCNKLNSSNPTPYMEAEPMWDMAELADILCALKPLGYRVVVTSWLAIGSTVAYSEAVRTAKVEWLNTHNFPYDELHMVKYGTTKANCTRRKGGRQILVDDNEEVRKGWHLGDTINANENIIEKLVDLLVAEYE